MKLPSLNTVACICLLGGIVCAIGADHFPKYNREFIGVFILCSATSLVNCFVRGRR
jgi:hypothetical protein